MWIARILLLVFMFLVVPLFFVASIVAAIGIAINSTGGNGLAGKAGLAAAVLSFAIFVMYVFSIRKAGWNDDKFIEPFADSSTDLLVFNWPALTAGAAVGFFLFWLVRSVIDWATDSRLAGSTCFLFAILGLVLIYNHFFIYFLHGEIAWSVAGILVGTALRMTVDPESAASLLGETKAEANGT